MSNASNEKIQMKKKNERLISSLNEEVEMTDFEKRKMKHAMRESHHFSEESRHMHERGGTLTTLWCRIKRGPIQSFNIREGANIPPKGIDPYMFPSKQKLIKKFVFH